MANGPINSYVGFHKFEKFTMQYGTEGENVHTHTRKK